MINLGGRSLIRHSIMFPVIERSGHEYENPPGGCSRDWLCDQRSDCQGDDQLGCIRLPASHQYGDEVGGESKEETRTTDSVRLAEQIDATFSSP